MQGFVMDMKQANTAALPALLPPPLKQGDLIAIVSPASKLDAALIDAAARQLTDEGFRVEVSHHAKGVFGSYSGTATERLSDLKWAIENPDVKAILCSRGGYGAVHLRHHCAPLPVEHEGGGVDACRHGQIHRPWKRFRDVYPRTGHAYHIAVVASETRSVLFQLSLAFAE